MLQGVIVMRITILLLFSLIFAAGVAYAQAPTPPVSPSPTVSVSPSPTVSVSPSPSPTPELASSPSPSGVVAAPVVVVGYGDGARGYEWLQTAILLFGFSLVILLLLFLVIVR